MARPGGNPNLSGGKGSGRKPLNVEIANLKERLKEEVTNEMLAKLARGHLAQTLETNKGHAVSKDIALPIALKNMVEKTDNKIEFFDKLKKDYE